jgi:uncharacterized membrane protein (UPF0127 family)
VVAGCLALVSCGRSDPTPLPTGLLTVSTSQGPATFQVEIADTPGARARGLMERTSLEPDAGMVFLFDEPTDGGFWMRDTLIPLSIAFWDARGRIVRVLDMAPCREDPCPTFAPGTSYVGAVELNVGALDREHVAVGDHVDLSH